MDSAVQVVCILPDCLCCQLLMEVLKSPIVGLSNFLVLSFLRLLPLIVFFPKVAQGVAKNVSCSVRQTWVQIPALPLPS